MTQERLFLGWNPSGVLVCVPLCSTAQMTPTFSSVLKPRITSTPLADDPTPSFIVKTEAIRRQLPYLPTPSVGGESFFLLGWVLGQVFHQTCNGAPFSCPFTKGSFSSAHKKVQLPNIKRKKFIPCHFFIFSYMKRSLVPFPAKHYSSLCTPVSSSIKGAIINNHLCRFVGKWNQ